MISNNVQATPRPRPPAQRRRNVSDNAPPPPYAPPLERLLDSPISVTAQLVAAASPDVRHAHAQMRHDVEEWMNEKSREEISDLLLKADGLIRSRESELSLTSALCKSLYSSNIALKEKHETLLARLPSPGPPSPFESPALMRFPSHLADQSVEHDDLARSPENLTARPAMSRVRHTRRISVTPSEITHLADQNAELLDKLEKLETESLQADQAGKRKLRKLEKEIQGLRDELENTRAKGAELEEQAKLASSMSASEAQRKKEEREERVKALKGKSSDAHEIKDFAPPSELTHSAPPSKIALPTRGELHSPTRIMRVLSEPLMPPVPRQADTDSSPLPASQPELEYVIVSQLLAKIRELEETNTQITSEQVLTAKRLRSAQWDAESIRRVYDCLGDSASVELQVIEDESPSPNRDLTLPAHDGTIRFSSLRRTIDGDLSRSLLSAKPGSFEEGIAKDMQSTARCDLAPRKNSTGHKTRKTVVGLFDSEAEQEPGAEPSSITLHNAHRPSFLRSTSDHAPPSPLSDMGDLSTWSTAATDGVDQLPSPSMPQSLLGSFQAPRTLGSELGSEFGDSWGENSGSHHLRTSSLYDLLSIDRSRNESISSVLSPVETPNFVFPVLDDNSLRGSQMEDLDAHEAAGPSTPPPLPALRFNVEAPTPPSSKDRSTDQTPTLSRAHRLSQTVRSRTNRWVEGRFGTASSAPEPIRRRHAAAAFADRADIDEDGASSATLQESPTGPRMRRTRGRNATANAAEEDEDDDYITFSGRPAPGDEGHARSGAATARPASEEKKEGFLGLLLELWLWLQFVIVILVFIWAMAKRGPKSVLEEAERRKTQHAGSRH